MKALLDQHLSKDIAMALRDRGSDVVAVSERSDLVGRLDHDILLASLAEGRAVVTNSVRDFRPLFASRVQQGLSHPGLILVPASRSRTRAATGALAANVDAIMLSNPDGIENRECWIPPLG